MRGRQPGRPVLMPEMGLRMTPPDVERPDLDQIAYGIAREFYETHARLAHLMPGETPENRLRCSWADLPVEHVGPIVSTVSELLRRGVIASPHVVLAEIGEHLDRYAEARYGMREGK